MGEDIKETFNFLKKRTHYNFLSTINGDKPSCRPFGDPVLFDNKIYILTNSNKNVAKQIDQNSKVCVVAYDNQDWIRINCELVDDSNNFEAKRAIINEFDWAEEAGYTLDNPDFKTYYMSHVDATIYDEEGNMKAQYNF